MFPLRSLMFQAPMSQYTVGTTLAHETVIAQHNVANNDRPHDAAQVH